jgi:hypothetical protein
MASLTQPETVEAFHLAFLDVLSHRLDRGRFVLKGGANLRYFFASVRYSEDIDLDLIGDGPWALEEKIDSVLTSPALALVLRSAGLTIAEFSKPKQTETTRRWKVAVTGPAAPGPVRTKIEFSARGAGDSYRLEPVPSPVVSRYALRAPAVQHYVDDAPAKQKTLALAGRSATQARDVFDLDLLLRRRPLPAGAVDSETLERAIELALHLPFAAFRDQVVPFLDVAAGELYGDEESWERMQTFVAEALERAR